MEISRKCPWQQRRAPSHWSSFGGGGAAQRGVRGGDESRDPGTPRSPEGAALGAPAPGSPAFSFVHAQLPPSSIPTPRPSLHSIHSLHPRLALAIVCTRASLLTLCFPTNFCKVLLHFMGASLSFAHVLLTPPPYTHTHTHTSCARTSTTKPTSSRRPLRRTVCTGPNSDC